MNQITRKVVMALYKYGRYFAKSADDSFDKAYRPGMAPPHLAFTVV